ncbi:MAG: ABC transporter permease subunit [Pseudomonadales bacterium]|nr:ABC transporter permease subunit [Pseudomonadales bacterium]NIX09424.1 ABC transporter permease subunit [Pseudomonadales bacterium]
MFLEVFKFESRFQVRSPLFLTISTVWFLIGFLITGSESVSVGGVGSNLNLNASFALIQTITVLTILGMFAAIAFVSGAITRDGETKTAEIFFSSGVSERSYLLGRFAGGFVFATAAVTAGVVGTMLGTFMPWLDPERVGTFTLSPYAFSMLAIVLPNMFVICALFFSVAALTRSMMASYVAALGFLVSFAVIGGATDPENIRFLALGEPFGQVALGEITRYWTVFDRNYRIPELTGTLLLNRLIWVLVAVAVLGITAARFAFELKASRRFWRRRRLARSATTPARRRVDPAALGSAGMIASLVSQIRMDFRGIIRSVPFYVLLAFGMLNVIGGFYGAVSQWYGTEVYPVTRIMAQVVGSTFAFVVLLILIYYSGELVHRERQSGVAAYLDAAPFSNGVMILSKIASLWLVISLLYLVVVLAGMIVQALNGYREFEPLLYVTSVFGVIGGSFYLWAVPAVLIQSLTSNKFFGMVALLVIFLGLTTLEGFGFEHMLYTFGLPAAPYSDMNGYGHFVPRIVSAFAYWASFCFILALVAHLVYPRGLQTAAERLATARQRLTVRVGAGVALAAIAFCSLGGWIFYNTNVLNEYLTDDDLEEAQADYEKAYRQYRELELLQVVDLSLAVDIFPDERRLESRGTARLQNANDEPLSDVHLTLAPWLEINELKLEGARLVAEDQRLGYYQYVLDKPLPTGAETLLSWDLSWINEGFPNSGATTRVVGNGTFVDNSEIAPLFGYDTGRELDDNNDRREYGLPPVERLPKLGDPDWLGTNQLGVSVRSDFRAVVSTSTDQIAVAPGYLQREWVEGDRRYFEYAMDEAIWPFVSFSSARYVVARDKWEDVNIEVYHDPKHPYNVDTMITATKKSLDYFTREFSPYQYQQFRILEFPAYASFAQSFPNTIPYSEGIGFIADLRDPAEIDYVFYVTAHELAHQWWAHQVVGAQMQGMTVIVETLAQYSALMVMEQEYGPARMRRFLKYELDNYLQSRGGELIEELPLLYVENQGYIHYRKGSVVMYALKDAIGEDAVNAALRSFIAEYGFKEGVFPTSRDLVDEFRAVAGPEHQPLITDLFERITVYDLAVADASVAETDGGYDVTITVSARKLHADGDGRETEVPLNQMFDLAIFPGGSEDLGDDDLPDPLLAERRQVVSGEQTFTVRVEERPERVGIDPYNKMIDRNPDDNLRSL